MRSKYLDDMQPKPGSLVICKADITGTGFTPGKEYQVLPGPSLINDQGEQVVPSARFVPLD